MRNVTNTLWSNHLAVSAFLDRPFEIFEHTTLNEKHGIHASEVLQPGQMPSMGYYVIGNGGHGSITGQGGMALTYPLEHENDHAALYNQIPFVLRRLNDDLPEAQRQLYALRKQVQFGGVDYIAYWAKRIDLSDVIVDLKRVTIVDGQEVSVPYVPTSDCLNPIPPAQPNGGSTSTSGEYLASTAIVSIPFAERDVTELFNVAKIIYGDERYAVISEFAYCTGVDRPVTISTPLGQVTFNEVIACQIASFVTAHYELVYLNQGFDLKAQVGAADPLLGMITLPNNP